MAVGSADPLIPGPSPACGRREIEQLRQAYKETLMTNTTTQDLALQDLTMQPPTTLSRETLGLLLGLCGVIGFSVTLPATRLAAYEKALAAIKHDPVLAKDRNIQQVLALVKGGNWRYFKVKYPEGNRMYAKMMEASGKVASICRP